MGQPDGLGEHRDRHPQVRAVPQRPRQHSVIDESTTFYNRGLIVKQTTSNFTFDPLLVNDGVIDIQLGRITAPRYEQTPDGTLRFGIGGTGAASTYGALTSSRFNYGGRLEAVLTGGFTPAPGNRFDVISSATASRSGAFSSSLARRPHARRDPRTPPSAWSSQLRDPPPPPRCCSTTSPSPGSPTAPANSTPIAATSAFRAAAAAAHREAAEAAHTAAHSTPPAARSASARTAELTRLDLVANEELQSVAEPGRSSA